LHPQTAEFDIEYVVWFEVQLLMFNMAVVHFFVDFCFQPVLNFKGIFIVDTGFRSDVFFSVWLALSTVSPVCMAFLNMANPLIFVMVSVIMVVDSL
jgi:hypothetical protein